MAPPAGGRISEDHRHPGRGDPRDAAPGQDDQGGADHGAEPDRQDDAPRQTLLTRRRWSVTATREGSGPCHPITSAERSSLALPAASGGRSRPVLQRTASRSSSPISMRPGGPLSPAKLPLPMGRPSSIAWM